MQKWYKEIKFLKSKTKINSLPIVLSFSLEFTQVFITTPEIVPEKHHVVNMLLPL